MFNVTNRFTTLLLLAFLSGCNYQAGQSKVSPSETTNPSPRTTSTPEAVSSPSETSSTAEDIPLPPAFNYDNWVQIKYQERGGSATYLHPGSLAIQKNSVQAWLVNTSSTSSGTMREAPFTTKVEVDCTRRRIKEMIIRQSVYRNEAVTRQGLEQKPLQQIENPQWNENERLAALIPNICNFLDVSDNGDLPLPPRFASRDWVHIADADLDGVVDKDKGQYPIYAKLENAGPDDVAVKAWVEFDYQQKDREAVNRFFLLLSNCSTSEDEWKFKGLASVGNEIIVEPSQENGFGSHWMDKKYDEYLSKITPLICKQSRV